MSLLAVVNALPVVLADGYEYLLSFMNNFVLWVSHQEEFLLNDLSMSFRLMLVTYLVICFGFQCVIRFRTKRFLYFLGSILLIKGVTLLEKYEVLNKNELLVFHKPRASVLGVRNGAGLFLIHHLDTTKLLKEQWLKDYMIGERVEMSQSIKPKDVFKLGSQWVVIVDSLGVYAKGDLNNPVVILQKSPKIHLERLIQDIKPKQVVADGSNYKSSIIMWEKTCKQFDIPFWYTGDKGAYTIK